MIKYSIFALCLIATAWCASINVAPIKDVNINWQNGCTSNCYSTENNPTTLPWSSLGGTLKYVVVGFPIPSLDTSSITRVELVITSEANLRIDGGYINLIDSTQYSETDLKTFNERPVVGERIEGGFGRHTSGEVVKDLTTQYKQTVASGATEFGLYFAGSGSAGTGQIKSREALPGGYYLRITYNGADSTSSAPSTTQAPTTTAPSTSSAAPSTAAPSSSSAPSTTSTTSAPISDSCYAQDVSGPNVASPARFLQTQVCSGNGVCEGNACKCKDGFQGRFCENAVTTTTNTPSSTAQISGDNNARASGAVETFVAASAVLVAAVAML